MATGNINYDYDQVIAFIKTTGAENLDELNKSISVLQSEVADCQEKFHCQGTLGANVVLKIYQGFSDIMGYSIGTTDGDGVAGLCAGAACLEITMYNEAMTDKKTIEGFEGLDSLLGGSSMSTSGTASGMNYSTDPRFTASKEPLGFDTNEKFDIKNSNKTTPNTGETNNTEMNFESEANNNTPDSGTVDASDIDFTRITNTAQKAADGDFMNVSDVQETYWGNVTEGKIDYQKQENGTYLLFEDGVAMGYTDSITAGANNITAAATTAPASTPSSTPVTAASAKSSLIPDPKSVDPVGNDRYIFTDGMGQTHIGTSAEIKRIFHVDNVSDLWH